MASNAEELPSLIAQVGPLNGKRWMIQGSILIGREEGCEIIITNRQVSRSHARLLPTNAGVLLEDLTSKNGTRLNGQPVTAPVLLQDGDVIQIALAQQFVFLSSDATLPLETSFHPKPEMVQVNTRLRLDKRSRRVWVLDQEVTPPLSVSQFQLLELLFDRQGLIVTRAELIEAVWKEENVDGVSEQALDALVRRLRDRLAAFDSLHIYIVTVRGHGLRLDNPPWTL